MGPIGAVWLSRYTCFLSLAFAALGLLLLALGQGHHAIPVFGF
jgi:hypothetical protein